MSDLRADIKALPTKADVERMVTQGQFEALRARVDTLESKVHEEGTSAFWAKVRTVGLTITAIAGAVAVIAAGIGWLKP